MRQPGAGHVEMLALTLRRRPHGAGVQIARAWVTADTLCPLALINRGSGWIRKEHRMTTQLPSTGFLRLPQIIGNPKANPPQPPIIPVCRSTWWAGVKIGRYPKPVKLSPRVTAWRAEDIVALIASARGQ